MTMPKLVRFYHSIHIVFGIPDSPVTFTVALKTSKHAPVVRMSPFRELPYQIVECGKGNLRRRFVSKIGRYMQS